MYVVFSFLLKVLKAFIIDESNTGKPDIQYPTVYQTKNSAGLNIRRMAVYLISDRAFERISGVQSDIFTNIRKDIIFRSQPVRIGRKRE